MFLNSRKYSFLATTALGLALSFSVPTLNAGNGNQNSSVIEELRGELNGASNSTAKLKDWKKNYKEQEVNYPDLWREFCFQTAEAYMKESKSPNTSPNFDKIAKYYLRASALGNQKATETLRNLINNEVINGDDNGPSYLSSLLKNLNPSLGTETNKSEDEDQADEQPQEPFSIVSEFLRTHAFKKVKEFEGVIGLPKDISSNLKIVLGDYYLVNRMHEEAFIYYIQTENFAHEIGKLTGVDTSKIEPSTIFKTCGDNFENAYDHLVDSGDPLMRDWSYLNRALDKYKSLQAKSTSTYHNSELLANSDKSTQEWMEIVKDNLNTIKPLIDSAQFQSKLLLIPIKISKTINTLHPPIFSFPHGMQSFISFGEKNCRISKIVKQILSPGIFLRVNEDISEIETELLMLNELVKKATKKVSYHTRSGNVKKLTEAATTLKQVETDINYLTNYIEIVNTLRNTLGYHSIDISDIDQLAQQYTKS